MQTHTILCALTLVVLLLCAQNAQSKILKVKSLEKLKSKLVDEGLELTLGEIGKSNSHSSKTMKALYDELQKKLNDPAGRFARTRCASPAAACQSCLKLARNRPNDLRRAMHDQILCNTRRSKAKKTCGILFCIFLLVVCSISDALFFVNAKSVSTFAIAPQQSTKLNAFLLSFIPSYDVEVSTRVGKLVEAGNGRSSELVDAAAAFADGLFEFGKKYVGCTNLQYTNRNTGMTVLNFYTCQEFTLNVLETSTLSFLYQLYLQASKDHEMEIKQEEMKAFFALFDQFNSLVQTNTKFSRQVIEQSTIQAQIARQTERPPQLKTANDFYTKQIAIAEKSVAENNKELDTIVTKLAITTEEASKADAHKTLKSILVPKRAAKKVVKTPVSKSNDDDDDDIETLGMQTNAKSVISTSAKCVQTISKNKHYKASKGCAAAVRMIVQPDNDN